MTRGVLRCAFKASFFVFLYFVLLRSRSIGARFRSRALAGIYRSADL